MTDKRKQKPNRDDSRIKRQFEKLEQMSPGATRWFVRFLRHPLAMIIRIPLGLALVAGGIFSILPFLGIWMLPLGLFLLAVDLPFLRGPVGRFIVWIEQQWARWKRWRAKRK